MGGSLLARPELRRLWLAGACGNSMRWLEVLVAGVVAFETTRSAFATSLVLVLRAVPMLLGGALAGALAEAVDRRRLLLASYALCAATALGAALLAASGLLRVWQLGLFVFLGGLAWTADLAGRRRMLAEAAGPEGAVRASALDTTTGSTTRMLGPILGGVVLELAGPAAAFALAACGYGAAFALVFRVAPPPPRPRARLALLGGVAEGVRIAARHPSLRVVILVTLVMNVFAFSFGAILPAFGAESFGAGPVGVGLLMAAEPAGALVGGLLLSARRGPAPRALWMVGGSAFFGVFLFLAAAAPALWLAVGLLAVGGLGSAVFAALQTGLVVSEAPPEARSRVLGLVTTCIGAGPAGVLAVGALAEAVGPALAIQIMAVAALALLAPLWRWAR